VALESLAILVLAVLSSATQPGVAADFDPASPESWLLDGADLYSVAVQGDRVWAVGYWGTALRSVDRGASWKPTATPTRQTLYAVDFADEQRGWAVGAAGSILRSIDGGATWTRQMAIFEDEFGERRPLDTHLFGIAAVSGDEAWAVGDMGVVLHVSDGESWRQLMISEETYPDEEALDRIFNAVHFVDSQHGWIVGEFGTILRTRDGGASWSGEREIQGAAGDLYLFDIAALDADRAATVGLAGSVLVTENGGQSWQVLRTGTSAPLYGLSWGNPSGAAVGDRGEIFTTEDRGGSWALPKRPPIFNWLQAVASGHDADFYAVGENGVVLRSMDGGRSWKQMRGASPSPRTGVSVPEMSGTTDPGLAPKRIPVPFEDGEG
jgi:photosystem II stability/assembly factor-like uncharacterized protein